MALFLIVAFLVIPVAEIAVFIQVGSLIGLWATLLGIVLTAIVGGLLVRRQGFQTIVRARASLDRKELPVAELFDGVCILFAGAMLLTPGFLTDTIGFLLLVPPVRSALRRTLLAELTRRGTFVHMERGGAGPHPQHPGPRHGPHGPSRGTGGQVIEGEFTEVSEEDIGEEEREPRRTASSRENPWRPPE